MNAQHPIQADYYARTAQTYDEAQIGEQDEHQFALALLRGLIDLYGIRSVLDVGAGTGRALLTLKAAAPGLRIVGVEPSEALRDIGYSKGLKKTELMDGDGAALAFKDGEFDLVTEFGVLHHVPKPAAVVSEMLRVAARGVFISDSNRFGQGSPANRLLKRTLWKFGLWPAFIQARTRGKGYFVSEGDGLFYSYSAFDNFGLIERSCRQVHVINTSGKGEIPKHSAPSVAILGLK